MNLEKILNNPSLLVKELENFFSKYDATVLHIQEGVRDNFERFPAPGDGILHFFTIHALFSNKGIFGIEGDYLDEIHPRFSFLYSKLASYLKKKGINTIGPHAQFALAIIPYVDPKGSVKKSLPKYMRKSRGQTIIASKNLIKGSPYYASLIKNYGSFVGIATNNNTIVGPDGGLIAAACKIASTFDKKISLLEFGSGGGSTTLAIARINKLATYIGNDFSREMVTYFKEKVIPKLNSYTIESSIFLGSCFEMPLEDKVDLISVGVYYQAQPSLFEKRGNKLVRCLNPSGVLIAQSGMIEDRFITNILRNTVPQRNQWPWYKQSYCLNKYFRYVSEYILEQEIVLVATNNYKKYCQIRKVFNFRKKN